MTTSADSCAGHAGLSAELRALALTALDRIEPVLDRVRTEQATSGAEACSACPVCAVLAAVRGERPELAVRLAEQAAGLVTVLRAALEEGAPTTPRSDRTDRSDPFTPRRHVQHIRVDREQAAR
jgi:hypothetical protein